MAKGAGISKYPLRRYTAPLLALVVGLFVGFIAPLSAQEDAEKSALLTFVEDKISTDNFRVSLNGIEGTLSSDVSFRSITLADRQGIWLTINQPRLIWSRSSLLLGEVDVESLTAESIILARLPEPDDSAPAAETRSFALPSLPVSVLLEKIEIKTIDIDQSVFGLASKIDFNGKLALEDGLLDLDVRMQRLDGPGGSLSLVGDFSSEKQWLKIAAQLEEPADGLFVNLVGIENRPTISLKANGDGPIAEFDMDLTFDVDERPILRGDLNLTGKQDGQLVTANLAGPLAQILPEQHRAFFGTNSRVGAQILLRNGGEIDVSSFAVKTGNVDLEGRAKLFADGFLGAFQVDMSVLPIRAQKVRLPIAGGQTLLDAVQLNIDYDVERQGGWTASLVAQGIEHPGMEIENTALVASGVVVNPYNSAERQFTFATRGQLDGLNVEDPQVAQAMGTSATLQGNGEWRAGQPVALQQLKLSAAALDLATTGKISGLNYSGTTQLALHRLAAFSGLVQRPLSGQVELTAQGETDFLTGGFDLTLDGTARQIGLGSELLDRLLQSDVLLSGRVQRNETGLGFDRLRLGNGEFHTALNGRFASDFSNLQAQGKIHDLFALSGKARGQLTIDLSSNGEGKTHKLNADISLPSGLLQNRQVKDLRARFDGQLDSEILSGNLSGSGRMNAQPVELVGRLAFDLEAKEAGQNFFIDGLNATVGATNVKMSLSKSGANPITGSASIASRDISDVASLALVDASGQVNGTLEFLNTDGLQSVSSKLNARKFRYETYRADAVDLVGSMVDVFGLPKVGATVEARGLRVAGTSMPSLSAKIGTSGESSSYQISARLSQYNTAIRTSGSIKYEKDQATLAIESLTADSSLTKVRLLSPTGIRLGTDRSVSVSAARLAVESGRVTVAGTAKENLNFQVDLQNIPLKIANVVQPNLGATGNLSGQLLVGGKSTNPQITYRLNGSGIGARQLASNGITNMQVSANGSYTTNQVDLESLTANNNQNISIKANGRIPLQGSGLRLDLEGTAPLSLGQFALASRGSKITGIARVNLSVTGSLQSPQPKGLVTVENATLSDPLSNLRLIDVGLLAGLENNRVTISRSSARLSSGGDVRVTGSVGLTDQFPADLDIALNGARYSDGQTFSSKLDGTLKVTGPLLADPTLSGNIRLAKTEIAVPDSFASGNELLEVQHVRPDASTAQTLARLEKATPKARPTSRPSILRLNLTISAPNQIFIRGRGLDAELGGSVRLTGPVNDVSPVGSFQLRRGRLSVIGQRFDLTEGRVTLNGDLDPVLYLLAQTEAGDVTAFITISGPASEVQVNFTSNPELPEDEVLAQIIFGRSIDELSPAQIIKLASIAAELTGGSSPGLVDSLRRGTGLDDLDIVEDKQGETAVKAGKYISDNVYVGVQAGQNSQEATINLDITDDLTARGSVDSEGGSSLGIFLEKDY